MPSPILVLPICLSAASHILCMITSFGGLSAAVQTLSVYKKSRLSLWKYLLIRSLFSVSSGLLAYLVFIWNESSTVLVLACGMLTPESCSSISFAFVLIDCKDSESNADNNWLNTLSCASFDTCHITLYNLPWSHWHSAMHLQRIWSASSFALCTTTSCL